MKRRLLDWLESPCCGVPLRLSADKEAAGGSAGDGAEISEGTLSCAACRREYPILGGVPRLTPGAETDPRVIKTRESFAWEWSRYPGSLPEDERIFLEETQIPRADFAGRLVLDAGCGMGRYSLVALSLGAEVVALDLSESLRRLAAVAPGSRKLHVVQGDLLRPPFRKGVFDIVYSQGVLHHTADTHAAFRRVAALVKPEGVLSVWLYGKAGRFEDFATNPIREDRSWLRERRRLAWVVVAVRHGLSDLARAVTTRLPMRWTYALCYPLAALGAVPGLKYLTFSVHPDFKVRLIENFDWVSPPFQYHHTKEELAGWFKAEGFSDLKVLAHGLVPKPGIRGRRRGDA